MQSALDHTNFMLCLHDKIFTYRANAKQNRLGQIFATDFADNFEKKNRCTVTVSVLNGANTIYLACADFLILFQVSVSMNAMGHA